MPGNFPSCCGPEIPLYSDSQIIELLESEKGYSSELKKLNSNKPSLMIASIYQNTRESGRQGDWYIRKLEKRLQTIIEENKWMMGRLRNLRVPEKRLAVVVEDQFCKTSDYIFRDVNDGIFEGIGRLDTDVDIEEAEKKYQAGGGSSRPQSADSTKSGRKGAELPKLAKRPQSQGSRRTSSDTKTPNVTPIVSETKTEDTPVENLTEKEPKKSFFRPRSAAKKTESPISEKQPVEKTISKTELPETPRLEEIPENRRKSSIFDTLKSFKKVQPMTENSNRESEKLKSENLKSTEQSKFDYPLLCSKLRIDKYQVKTIANLADKDDGHLFRAGIIQNTTRTKFCLFLSGSSAMFDASTIYQMWKQLSFSEKVIRINPERKQNFEEKLQEHFSMAPRGISYSENQKETMKCWLKAAKNKGMAQKLKKLEIKNHLLEFDLEEIKNIKTGYKSIQCMSCGKNANWVSTNDIITSWIREIVPKAGNIMMAIDCREKLDSIEKNDGGNYVTTPFLSNNDLETPLQVRSFMNKVLRPNNKYEKLDKSEFKHFMGGVHTNLAKFYHHVEPDGFKQLIHFPVVQVEDKFGVFPLGIEINLVTFKSNRDRLAGYVVSKRKDLSLEKLEGTKIVKGAMKLE